MPKDSVNLYLSIQSGSSERTLVSLTDKTRALDKENQLLKQATEALAKANKPLTEEQVRLQAQMKASQKTVNDLQKVYAEQGDELSKLNLDHAIEEHAKLKVELSEVNAQLGANQKTYKEYLETVRKGTLSGTGGGGIGSGTSPSDSLSLKNMAKGLVIGQVGQMFSSSLGGLGQAVLTSMIGTPEASLISDALSNAISGGAAGAMFGPWGIAAGAALGGLSGLISGGTKIFEARDDAFKDYYGGLYQDVSGRSGEMVGGGSTLASGRQTDRISFKTMFGDEQTAKEYLENIVDMANHTPFLYDDLVAMSKTLATYGYSPDEGSEDYILDALQTIGDTGAALGMGTGDMTTVAQALGRMKSSDKTTLEYLNILNDRGIGAVGMLAQARGVSQGDMYDMISKGEISGSEAVTIITEALQEAYSGAMEEQSQTFAGISSTLEGLTQELENAGGEGYNTLRKSGQSAMVEAYQGELGESIKEINRIMGENQARKENLQDQYMREVLDRVMNGNRGELWSTFNEDQQNRLTEMSEQYAYLMRRYENGDTNAGAELESLYEQAQVLGKAYFENSDFVKVLNETELDQVDAIRAATCGLDEATRASYELSQKLSKGLVVTPSLGSAAPSIATTYTAGADARALGNLTPAQIEAMRKGNSHAFGLDRVPYDDYPALLHEGERVLTASEARAQDAGTGSPVSLSITGNYFTGTPEEMADQLAQIILQRLTEASIAAAPK